MRDRARVLVALLIGASVLLGGWSFGTADLRGTAAAVPTALPAPPVPPPVP